MNFLEMLKQKLNIDLNEQQSSAVLHKDGPAIILAVPGSGKTTTLICRTANLIMNHGVDPNSILSMTFSKASANDMKQRFERMFNESVNQTVHFSTIHSFAFTIIRHYCNNNYSKIPSIIEGEDSPISKLGLLKNIYFEVNEEYISEDRLEELSNTIGYIKNMLIDAEEINEDDYDIPELKEIIKKYESIKKQNKYMDYDDMLVYALNILRQYSPVLNMIREKYKYIQVDEGQDTSKIQHEIIKLIAAPNNNLFLVADDDQSIYGFRGAYPRFLLEFNSVYSNAKVYYMEENYRSTKDIVNVANKFIRFNTQRYAKNLFTNNKLDGKINILNFKNESEQYNHIIEQVKRQKRLSDTAVLFRNNISCIPIVDILEKNNIGFYIREKKMNFFNHWITQDITAFIKLSLVGNDIGSFEKVYYKMNLYISKEIFNSVKNNFGILRKPILDVLLSNHTLNKNQKENILRVKHYLEQMSKKKPIKVIEIIENYINYRDYIEQNSKKNGCSLETANNILSAIKSIAVGLENVTDFLKRLERLKTIIEEGTKNRGADVVTLSTIHSAKGLEFEEVFMIDLIDEQFPTYSSIDLYKTGRIEALEEERRLFYVGITRGKRKVSLPVLNTKNDEKAKVSRFVQEIDSIINGKKEIESRRGIKKNCIIVHNYFGKGKILNIDGDTMDIAFEGFQKKTLSIDMCIKNKLIWLIDDKTGEAVSF